MPASEDPLRPLVAGLDESQREAVTSPEMPLCILAGAGSGKTRVLTRRIAYRVATGSADARRVLALTFSRRAASELSHRLAQLGVREQVTAGTFHAIAYASLRRYWVAQGFEPPELLERKGRLLGPLLGPQSRRGRNAPVTAADVAAEIEWARARLVRPSGYAEATEAVGRVPPLPAEHVAGLYLRYEERKRELRLVDFDDLLSLCANAFTRDETFATTQRQRFAHLFVDEYQDVNALQHRLLEAWRGNRPDLCVVGDPDQAIYAWNGADASFLREFAAHHPGATVLRLGHNYRSSPQILAAGAAVLAELPDPSPRPVAHQPDGPRPTMSGHDDELAEATAVARHLAAAAAGGRAWAAMAVLTRTNAQLAVLEAALRRAGIPYRVRGGGSLVEQAEVKAWLARRAPSFTGWLGELAGAVADTDAAMPAERRANLEQLLRLGHEHARLDPGATLGGFRQWLTTVLQGVALDGEADAVDLVTFHAAKGLEWPVVVLAGMEKGFVPHSSATTPGERAEEVRLVYVAVTRAAEELHLTWAEQRTFGERTARRTVSPLADVILGLGAPRPVAVAGARVRRVPGAGVDTDLLRRLKDWRRDAARDAGVPAYVVFNDATLEAIAATRPTSLVALRSVSGVGPVKVERYGDAVLALVAAG